MIKSWLFLLIRDMQKLPSINLANYHYELPSEKIAQFPLQNRDEAKLLVYKNGEITHNHFYELADFLPKKTFLVFNDTKVIPARLVFTKSTGAKIEVFLLHPIAPSLVAHAVMQTTATCTWQCMIGNKKRWKNDEKLSLLLKIDEQDVIFEAKLSNEENNEVTFTWNYSFSFATILAYIGELPLPPYLKRKATIADNQQYQTVYSQKEGAVAAPTAGLHFTERVFNTLSAREIEKDFLTLHVGAGTFQPIKEQNVVNHAMHIEQVVISKKNIQNLLAHTSNIVAVGTTSMRTLESLYWYGVKLIKNSENVNFQIEKLYPYQWEKADLPSVKEAFEAILKYMEQHSLEEIIGETAILILPGYVFKVCKGIITNFHMPDTTLILLIAAFVGDNWRKIYDEALKNDYRFLSYGDSSLLLP